MLSIAIAGYYKTGMTNEHRNEQTEIARKEYAAARAAYDSQAKWNSKKKAASENLEFWGSKLAFLENAE